MAPRPWTCRDCGQYHSSKQVRKCQGCGKERPKTRKPKHMAALELPYEAFIEANGGVEVCGICERGPQESRKLDRDHSHKTGEPRGLLCWRHNRGLQYFNDDPELLAAAISYLQR